MDEYKENGLVLKIGFKYPSLQWRARELLNGPIQKMALLPMAQTLPG